MLSTTWRLPSLSPEAPAYAAGEGSRSPHHSLPPDLPMGDYKKQHTITKAYLRGFTSQASPNTLWRYEKETGTREQRSIDNATVKFHAYSFRDRNGKWNHAVENLLGDIESIAIPILEKLDSGRMLSASEKHDMSLFIGAMIRRPASLIDHFHREFIKHRNDPETLHGILNKVVSDYPGRFSIEEIDKARIAINEGRLDIKFDAAKAAQLKVWVNAMSDYQEILTEMHWELWKAERGSFFLTSDAPAFVRRRLHENDMGVVGLSRADLGAELTFPISRRTLLIAKHAPCKYLRRATKTRVRELNGLMVRMAHKHVFGPTNSDLIWQLVEENKSFPAPLPDLSDLKATLDQKYTDKELQNDGMPKIF